MSAETWQLKAQSLSLRYNEAKKVKLAQDAYCAKAQSGQWSGLPASIPSDLKWEALVDVLRGRVKVSHPTLPSNSLLTLRPSGQCAHLRNC